MSAPQRTRHLFWIVEAVLLTSTLAAGASLSRSTEWQPLVLVVLLLVLALLGQWLSIEISVGQMSPSFVALILVMVLLGPVPAAAYGIAVALQRSALARHPPALWLNNLTSYSVVPFVGGLIVRVLLDDFPRLRSNDLAQSVIFGLIVFCVFLMTVVFNWVLVGLDVRVEGGRPVLREIRESYLPLLSAQLATGMIATVLAVGYRSVGLPLLFGSIAVFLVVRHLTVALLRSEERAEQLEARSIQLVGLQMGVLRTLERVLGMRDKASGRHAAAVAGYAKALAVELGCSEEEQEVVHMAGLLHEIGKFTWPDRLLHSELVEGADLEIVKSHPQEGAVLVGALDGYGEVADAILYHHERVDGRGYPAGLIGNEIPLASRIVAICSIYDIMTAGDTYRSAMPPVEAMDELRRAANAGQLDAELVERFLVLLDRNGATFAKDASFEAELDYERRVRRMALPHAAKPATAHPQRSARASQGPLRALVQRTPKD